MDNKLIQKILVLLKVVIFTGLLRKIY